MDEIFNYLRKVHDEQCENLDRLKQTLQEIADVLKEPELEDKDHDNE
jgi:serine/threonine protein phosphatase PrpC